MRLWTYAFIGWLYCSAIMGIGQMMIPIQALLILHAIAAPAGFTLLAIHFYHRSPQSRPIYTALFFTGFVIMMDFFVVALLIMKDFAMFRNPVGTWIPFILIFLSVWVTGNHLKKRQEHG